MVMCRCCTRKKEMYIWMSLLLMLKAQANTVNPSQAHLETA
jgi:hypothetical protein